MSGDERRPAQERTDARARTEVPARTGARARTDVPERIDAPGRPTLTAADLERWQEGGATWRALEITDDGAVVELCACTGEPVDVLAGSGREFVAFVRAARNEPA